MDMHYKFETDQNYIQIKNKNDDLVAFVDLINGGSLQYLELNGITLIEQKKEFAYSESFASALLFPFVNRLKNGIYSFKNKSYQFPINETGGNAHHGVLFNKIFSLKDYFIKDNEAIIILNYESKQEDGFPFAFNINLQYTFGFNYLNISLRVDNLSEDDFPYSLGWHPYFKSSNLSKSCIKFSKSNDIITDVDGVALHCSKANQDVEINPSQKHLDNCFQLKNGEVEFNTPQYKMSISTNRSPAFIHLYTPKIKDLFAIELTSGISNSFNHGIGLSFLDKGSSTNMTWNIKIDSIK
jgi:aldose 1-epimerase